MAILTLLPTQSDTRSISVGHNDAVTRVYHDTGNVIETHEHAGEFRGW